MSDLVKRLRTGPYDRFDPCKDRELEAADRIEALEAALRDIAGDEQGVLAKETTAGRLREYASAALAPETRCDVCGNKDKAAARIEVLEASLFLKEKYISHQAPRIAALRAALREALAECTDQRVYQILDAALASEQDK
jgi:hypothetical protein